MDDDIKLPQIWFSKTYLENGITFEEPITEKNCAGWNRVPYEDLNNKAELRIANINKALPDKWQYKLLGWRL